MLTAGKSRGKNVPTKLAKKSGKVGKIKKIIYNFALAKAKHLRLDSGKASRRRDSSVG